MPPRSSRTPAWIPARIPAALALALALALPAACGGGGGDAAQPVAGPPQAEHAFLPAYIAIQETLADDRVSGLAELGAEVVTAAAAHRDQPGIDALIAGAGRIASPDIETARVAFEKMSRGVIAYLAANPSARGDYEQIHCPMAFNNQGAPWVQRRGELRNPYHGKMMLRCGDRMPWGDDAGGSPAPIG